MSNYDPNCWMCKTAVYAPIFIVALVVLWAAIKVNSPEFWTVIILALLIFFPTGIWVSKRMPMVHEYFKRGKS